ncbi:MAG: N-acetyltransferase [Candidatus Nezhaarchaeota archaeon]|nr:N-acetyltransferase [Candidatus Nezhaarchaeota archaeon]
MRYISPRAKILGPAIIGEAVVLGPSIVGEGCFVEDFAMLGHPVRGTVLDLLSSPAASRSTALTQALDELSGGVKLGRRVIVRSGTVIYEGAELKDNVETGHFVLIREGCRLASGVRIGSGTVLDGYVKVGADTNIQSRAFLPPKTVVGERVFIGPGVIVTNDKYPCSGKLVETIIEDEAVVGAGAVLVAGVKVKRRAVVAAGAVVTRDVEEGEVVAGCPAKRLMSIEEYERRREAYVRAEG